ncbi:MAG: CAP domain-containing protein [Candidatus Saccharimonadales bacterium]
MPVKTHKTSKKHPQHFAKVYWPYLPLVILVSLGLWLGHPGVERSQRGVLSYSTDVNAGSLLVDSNNARASNGQSQLISNPKLTAAAQAKAQDMANHNYWSHITPEGNAPWKFIDATGYSYQKAGENLAYGFSASDEVIKGWLNSPSHKANLLDANYKDVGFGIVNSPNFRGEGPETIVVALYGTPTDTIVNLTTSKVTGFNSLQANGNENDQTITKAQALTGGKAPWITLVIGIAAGAALAFFIAKHSVQVHRTLRKGEKFVVKHPVIDLTVIAFIAICAMLSQSVGLIR